MEDCFEKCSKDCFRLDGKVAIVTGGNTKLGQNYALALAKAGANLIIHTNDTNWDKTRNLIEKEGREIIFVKGNLNRKEDRETVIRIAMEVYGKIDILVNNSEFIKRPTLLNYSNEDWNLAIEEKLDSAYYLSLEIGQIMTKQKSGKIINVESIVPFNDEKYLGLKRKSYKHTVESITKEVATELALSNIQVNAIKPNYSMKNINCKGNNVKTDEKIISEKSVEQFDLIVTLIFLASKVSNYINGHILPVNIGYSI